MALGIDQFAPETFAQANPQFSAIQATQSALQGAVTTAYAQPLIQQKLQAAQLANVVAAAQAKYAMPQQLAQTQLAQAKVPNMAAQTQAQLGAAAASRGAAASSYATAGLTGQKQSVLAGQQPYLIQKAQGDVYTRPIAQTAFEYAQANNNPAMANILHGVGIPTSYGPNGQQGAETGSPGSSFGMPGGGLPGGAPFQPGMAPAPMQPGNGTVPVSGLNPAISPLGGAPNSGMPATGIAPNIYNGSIGQNTILFGSAFNPLVTAQMQAQGKAMGSTYVSQWNAAQQDAQKDAILGNTLENSANQFLSNYNKSKYTGPIEGKMPSNWAGKILSGGQDLTPEQLADNATQNMGAAVAKLIAGGRVSNYEMQYVQNMKPNRQMTQQAANTTAQYVRERGIRSQERQAFNNAAQAQGITIPVANGLWNEYQVQRPVYNFQTNKPNDKWQSSWSDYLTPQAVQAQQAGQQFTPASGGYSKRALYDQGTTQYGVPRAPDASQSMVSVMSPDGKVWKLSAANAALAVGRGGKIIS